jgi:NADH:ubiquinone oxidoreductase subunit E
MTDRNAALADVLRDHHPSPEQPANILRTLLAVEQALGHIPAEALAAVAKTLGVPEPEVAGVVSYYPDLHTKPRGRHIIRLCMGEACVANRSFGLLDELKRELSLPLGETPADSRFTVERVYCLGNCGVGPTVMVDDTIYGRMTGSTLLQILKDYP